MKENYLLVENFLDEGKIFICGKLPWWRKNICLWETSLIKEKCLFVENVLDEGKNICLWKPSLMKQKYLLDKDKNAKKICFEKKKNLSLKILFYYFDRNHSQLNSVDHY